MPPESICKICKEYCCRKPVIIISKEFKNIVKNLNNAQEPD